MTFKEKIDNILKISKKKFNTIQDLEVAAGLGMNTLRKAYNDNREPSPKVQVKLLEEIGINEHWWDTGNGEVYVEKPTPVQQQGDNNEKSLGELEVYRKVFEGKTEYLVIPRKVLEKTQLVSIDELERKNSQIDLLIKMLGIELSKVPGFQDDKKKA